MEFDATIPVLRMLSEEQARTFYQDYLGCQWDWERRSADGSALHAQVSRGALRLQLSSHPGDAAPGASTVITMTGVDALCAELHGKSYSTSKPLVSALDGGGAELLLTDPSGNRLRFTETSAAARWSPPAPTPLTRAQVRAEYLKARAEGTLPRSGEV